MRASGQIIKHLPYVFCSSKESRWRNIFPSVLIFFFKNYEMTLLRVWAVACGSVNSFHLSKKQLGSYQNRHILDPEIPLLGIYAIGIVV